MNKETFSDNLLKQSSSNCLENSIHDVYTPFVDINRNDFGEVISVNYYSEEGDIEKQILYENSEIFKIRYYKNNKVVKLEDYVGGLNISSKKYDKNGNCIYQIKYTYDKYNRIFSIAKIIKDREFSVKYEYDEIGRIISRKFYVDFNEKFFQEYRYDILNNLVEYIDSNQHILVESLMEGKLLSYKIINSLCKEILVINNFKNGKYQNTRIVTEENDYKEVNINYVDNFMMKKPFAKEEDLDLVISQLMQQDSSIVCSNSRVDKSEDILDEYIKFKILPISIRKRVLYNLSLKVNV